MPIYFPIYISYFQYPSKHCAWCALSSGFKERVLPRRPGKGLTRASLVASTSFKGLQQEVKPALQYTSQMGKEHHDGSGNKVIKEQQGEIEEQVQLGSHLRQLLYNSTSFIGEREGG